MACITFENSIFKFTYRDCVLIFLDYFEYFLYYLHQYLEFPLDIIEKFELSFFNFSNSRSLLYFYNKFKIVFKLLSNLYIVQIIEFRLHFF